MAKRNSDLFPAVIGGGLILLALFFHSIYEDLLKATVLKRLSAFMGVEETELVSRLTEMAIPIMGSVAVVWFLYGYLKRELRAQIPDPAVEAQQQYAAAILAQTEALARARPQNGSESLPDIAPVPSEVDGWKSPLEAIEAFADKSLLATKDNWVEKFSDTDEKIYQSEREIVALTNSTDLQKDKKLKFQRMRNEAAVSGHKFATDQLRRAWTDLRADIGKRLESGELIAKGVPAPYAAGKGEIEIAPHEWRLLEINPNDRAEAIERGSGGAARYVGIVIGKRI